jgi:hypothetical protein
MPIQALREHADLEPGQLSCRRRTASKLRYSPTLRTAIPWGVRVKSVTSSWSSSLTQAELERFFKTTSDEIFNTGFRRALSVMPKPGGSTGKTHFFTPEESDSPFTLEQPIFSVGVQGPQGGGFGAAVAMAVHMYVFEDGSGHRVDFSAPYGFQTASRGKAMAHLERYGRALTAIDPGAHARR